MSKTRQQSLREAREAALEYSRKGNHRAALSRFHELERLEPAEADWPRRAAECLRVLGDSTQQVAALGRAAELYAQAGSMAKAIAMCRMILTLDPKHTQTQERLSTLQQHGALAATARFQAGPSVRATETSAQAEPHAPSVSTAPATDVSRPRPELGRLLRQKYGERNRQEAPRPHVPTLMPEPPVLELEPVLPILPQGSLKEAVPGSKPIRDPRGTPSGMHRIDMGEVRQAERSLQAAQRALPATPLFSELGPRSLERLIAHARLEHYEPGTSVYRAGDPAATLHVIVSGTLAMLVEQPERIEVARLNEGEFFGEAALMSNEPRQATAEAVESTDVLSIDCATIRDLIVEEPRVLRTVLHFLRERLIESSTLTNPLFTILSAAERRRLAAHFEFVEIDPGSLIIWQGVRSPGLFLLLSGGAEVVHDDSLEERRLATLRPGAVFGEMSLLDDRAAMADVRCATRSYALLLPRAEFQTVAKQYPAVVEFIRLLSESRRGENEHMLGASVEDE
jgi:cAMP-dependent protein kinase regulator